MGKLIRMGTQERRLLWPKRLHWSRLLFLLGMLIIGSTYQHLRRPRGLPSLWASISSQQPVKLASRDLPNDEMMMVSGDPPKAGSEMEGETLAPQATVGGDEATPSIIMENTPSTPRRTTKITPTTPKNNYSPTVAGTERVKENTPTTPSKVQHHYTPTSSRQTVKNYTPTRKREMESYSPTQARGKVRKYRPSPPGGTVDTYAPFTLTTVEMSQAITPRTTVKDSETTATYKTLETNSPKSILEETTPTTLKGIVGNSPTFLENEVKTNILTSPRSIVEKNTLTTSRRVENNSSTNPWRSVRKTNLTTPQGTVLEHTAAISEGQVITSTTAGSSPAGTKASTDAWSVRNPLPQTSTPAIRTAPATIWGLAKKSSIVPSISATPMVKAYPITQVRHYVVVESAPAVPTMPSWSLTTLLPEAPSPSPSVLPSSQADFYPKGEYPVDLFSVEERQQGWVVLHIFGMMYVFVALAIVCDEYFVPSLGVITDKLQISEDVAGATFMAAGGSAPELFTSLIGVFISHSNVGIGTIVGSAVFNILFVIGTCSLFSREILNLTWWPLFRDVTFYIFDLIMLILFFLDSLIAWWESLLLLLAYILYVFTMKWNKQIELWVKEQISRRPVAKVMALGDLSKTNEQIKLPSLLTSGSSSASLHNSTTRSTIYQLMLRSLDPLGEAHPSEDKEEESLDQEATAQSQTKAESKLEEEEPAQFPAVTVTPTPAPDVKGDQEEDPGGQEDVAGADGPGEVTGEEGAAPGAGDTGENSGGETQPRGTGEIEAEEKRDNGNEGEREIQGDGEMEGDEGETEGQESHAENEGEAKSDEKGVDGDGGGDGGDSDEEEEEEEEEDDDEEEEGNEEPLSLDWPETRQKQAIYLFLLPIVLPLWLTVPDVRRQESRKFFVITFLGSIVWIAMFSYLMVWWAHQVGETIGISEEIMGLTILAAGTSIPDLITSVIVARKGLGDMAVSSSVGSNIFDITVGLPVPWLLFSLIHGLRPVPVSSNGLFCAIVLLFLMLLFVISSIALCKWRMNKILGFVMFLLYFVFLVISVLLEDRIISCPVSV
ncbi:PREDICTED: sodium/potassium/calcium exchanger 1 [Galeopterus variegatus]|uniref:Sodium/potassium/calcium exchanger 1 n=1 Tax=Galeopterus variegatus TaxID=482537 RepID=A0ABM0QZ09_GALVR|nr:PREDICTED: sodium/potassium/calcium exchanger 1 [Galeopterus variegatus]